MTETLALLAALAVLALVVVGPALIGAAVLATAEACSGRLLSRSDANRRPGLLGY